MLHYHFAFPAHARDASVLKPVFLAVDFSAYFRTGRSPQSFGLRESVCKVKPDGHYSQKEAKIKMDSDVHGDCGDSLTDTIQHLLYAEAQSEQSGNNGGNTSEVGEAIVESLHPQLPHLS
jgi:hypothetical protein